MKGLTPARRRGVEILDDPGVSVDVMRRSMRDVERANALFGGRRAVIAELRGIFPRLGNRATMLDVGTARGDIPAEAQKVAAEMGLTLRTVGIDISEALLSAHGSGNEAVIRGDAMFLPIADDSVDVVIASQLLHHFPADQACRVVSELNRVARRAVVISDLRRSLLAAAGLWMGSFPLGFHPVSRHDGVVSVMRGFVPRELADIVERAVGHPPVVKRRLGFRLTATWVP
ncbi:MAG: methyltransferase domain-containing protein [Gemmatimonadaceae bacterium]